MEAAMPCKKRTKPLNRAHRARLRKLRGGRQPYSIPKTKHAWIVEAHRAQRGQRLESSLPKNHEDHIAGKGYTSMTHYNLVHKFTPMLQAMKIPNWKAAVDKEWKKLETFQLGSEKQGKSKREVVLEAQRDKRKVHFATLMRYLSSQECGVRTKMSRKFCWSLDGRMYRIGNVLFVHRKKQDYSSWFTWWLPCGRNWWKMLILMNTQRECKPNEIIEQYREMFESRISAGATKITRIGRA